MLKYFKKANTPTFDGDMEKVEDVEAWLSGIVTRLLSYLHTL